MKRLLTAASVAAALVAAGCTSGDSTADTADTTAVEATTAAGATTTAVAATTAASGADTTAGGADTTAAVSEEGPPAGTTGPAPGVTDDTIKIGVTYIDLGTTQVSTNHGDYEAAYTAKIAEINGRGGINGRMIEPVFAPIALGEGANADAVCVQLTEDEDVFAVVGFFLGDAPACYLETHETAILGGNMTDELYARAQAPWYSWDPGGDFSKDALARLVDEGVLSGTIGILGTASSESFVTGTVAPLLEELGVNVAEVAINDAPEDDQVLSDAQNAAILQKFEASGVDTLLATGNDVVGALTALETTTYRPRVVGTDYGVAGVIIDDPERDHSVLDGFTATGIYGPVAAQQAEADYVACGELMKAAGIDYYTFADWEEGQPKPWVSASAACQGLTLFEAIATKAGQDLNYGSFRWAGDNLGDLKLPGSPDPYFFGAPPHADGDAPVFLYEYDPAAKAMVLAD